MKNIKKYILATAVLGVLTTSCTEDQVLDLNPIASLSDATAFSSPSLIANAVNGMYNAAQIGAYNGSGRGYPWGAAYIQQNDMRGEDLINTQAFYQVTYQGTWDPTGAANSVYYWVDSYRLINRVNVVIEGVEKAVKDGVISKALGDHYIGEAKFLRGITHFELLMFFSRPYADNPSSNLGIPYRTTAIQDFGVVESAYNDKRLTVADSYAKVLEDLDDAESKLNSKSVVGDVTRVSKEAAVAFKARVKLHKADWSGVLNEVAKISNSYTLTSTPSGVFENNNSNTESIFSIGNSANVNPGVNGALASQYKRRTLIAISPIIWNDTEWLEDDKRRLTTDKGDVNGEYMIYKTETGLYTNKYRDDVNYTDSTPIIRFAEVLLMKAEAEARLNGVTSAALDALNAVRDRALTDPSTQSYTLSSFTDKEAFVKAVIKERRIEFLAEGKRWADIHRLQFDDLAPISGVPGKMANGFPVSSTTNPYGFGKPAVGTLYTMPYSSHLFVWPLPTLEVQYNPTLAAQQNPNY